MSRANKLFGTSVTPKRVPDTINKTGYSAFNINIKEKYVEMLLTNTIGNTFYVKQNQLLKDAENIHKKMIEVDPSFAAKAIVYARNKGYMRLQPIYGLAMLSKANVELFKSIFNDVIRTPNDLADFYSIRGKGGRGVKTAVSNWLKARMSEYWAIKYGSDKKSGYSLGDILRVAHPKGEDNPIFNYLRGKETDINQLKQIKAFEELKRTTSDSEKVRLITEGRLPHEVATTFAGNSPTVWNSIVPQMPIFALLKNLATIERHGVADSNKEYIQNMFSSPEIIQKSKVLPFRFLEAEKHVSKMWIKDALRDALDLSFSNIPDIQGNTAVFLDHSGSMNGDFMLTSSIFGVGLAMKTENGRLLIFDDQLEDVEVSKRDSLLTQAKRIKPDGCTNTGAPFELITREKTKYDNIILITDGQQNRGTAAHIAFDNYRKLVNKNVKLFLIDVSPYGVSLFDNEDKNIHFITGWSDDALNYISIASNGWGDMINVIENSD